MRSLAMLAMVGCAARPAPARIELAEGLAIAVYQNARERYVLVDDRRTVEVVGGAMVLDRIDPAAPLEALAIEPLDGQHLRVTSCVRERLADTGLVSPLVRCRVDGAVGRHRVRVVHVTRTLAFEIGHDVVVRDRGRATVTTRLAFATPAWGAVRARLVLFDGLPGDDVPPQQLADETVILDGSTSIIAGRPREVAATLRAVYRGIRLVDGEDDRGPADIGWGAGSHHRVWQWLELPLALALAGAPVRVDVRGDMRGDVRGREVEVAATAIERGEGTVRIPLWIDEDLLGTRVRAVEPGAVSVTDRFQLSVANLGDVPREVWIEEPLRAPHPRRFVMATRVPAQLAGGHLRVALRIAPGATERIDVTLEYDDVRE